MKQHRKEKSEAEGSHEAESSAERPQPPRADHKEAGKKKDDLEELHATIEALQKEKDELFGKLQRVSADYANYQKRVPKQISDTISYEKERIIRTLIPALDNFEHTLAKARSAEKVDVLVKGIRIIYEQLIEILKSHNVEQIEALGEQFDPAVHEAVTQRTEAGKDENVVLEEFQKGYKLNGRVIRPSRVIVNRLPAEEAGKQEDATAGEQTNDVCEAGDQE